VLVAVAALLGTRFLDLPRFVKIGLLLMAIDIGAAGRSLYHVAATCGRGSVEGSSI
jgi:hypothetical protein